MNKIILILAMTIAVSSCGSKSGNKVDSGSAAVATPPTTSAITPIQPINPVRPIAANFEGNYDLIEMERGNNCGANISIVSECGGYRVLSNNMGPEEFCNVNKFSDNDRNPPNPDRNPPNPDRNPPNPDRNPPSQYDRKIVTQEGNLLKSVIKVNEQLSFTSSMILRNGGILEKMANFKSSQIRCIYQKR